MTFFTSVSTHIGHLSEHVRVGGVSGAGEYFAKLISRKVQNKAGTNIYTRSEEWDLLIILDAARVDAMQKLSSDYEFLDTPGEITSVASSSETWMKRTFTDTYRPEMEETVYVCANPFSDELLLNSCFSVLSEVWRSGWSDQLGTVPAPVVTDAAINIGRNQSPKRMVVHYMQPHFPSIPHTEQDNSNMNLDTFGEEWESIWDELRAGKVSRDNAWIQYIDNLEYVLQEVENLITNIFAEDVVITADHGNAFGEWWQWGHPKYVEIDPVRRVPWYSTKATDKRTIEPPREESTTAVNKNPSIDDRLQALGYK